MYGFLGRISTVALPDGDWTTVGKPWIWLGKSPVNWCVCVCARMDTGYCVVVQYRTRLSSTWASPPKPWTNTDINSLLDKLLYGHQTLRGSWIVDYCGSYSNLLRGIQSNIFHTGALIHPTGALICLTMRTIDVNAVFIASFLQKPLRG